MCEITGVCHITGFYAVVSGVVCVKQPVFVILPDFYAVVSGVVCVK